MICNFNTTHMLFRTIDYLFGTRFQNHPIIQNIQNANCLIVSTFTAIGTLNYFTTSSYTLLPYTLKLIIVHCTMDLLLTNKLEMIVHHLVSIGLASFFFSKPLPLEYVHFEAVILSLTELSSFFLVGREWIPKQSPWYVWNNYMFLVSFFYFRLYLLPKYLLLSPEINNFLLSIFTITDTMWYYSTLYALMGINIYWGAIMIKTIVKQLRTIYQSVFSYKVNEYFLQYTYYFTPIIACCVYNSQVTNYNLFDFTGLCILAYNSGNYHRELYTRICQDPNQNPTQINVYSSGIRSKYISDIMAIQLRAFLFIVSKLLPLYPRGMPTLGGVLFFHCIIIYHYYDDLLVRIDNKIATYYDSKDTIMDYALKAPLLVNLILAIIYSNTVVNAHHILLSIMAIMACLFLRPGHEINHTLIHMCLLYQTYALCMSNI